MKNKTIVVNAAPTVAWCRECVCGRSCAGISGSNPTGGVGVPVSVVCCQEEVSASG
jgi:hypothetical protein